MRVPLRGNSWRLLLPAALLLAVLCLAASAPAKDLEEKLHDTQGKLSHVRESQSALAATIAEQNQAIDSMIGEVSALRQQQAAVEAELSAKQDELDTRDGEAAKPTSAASAWFAPACSGRSASCAQRLVAIYESGSPDMLNVVLDSASWSEVTTRADYLDQVQEYDDSVAARVKGAARRSARRGQADDRGAAADQGRARRDRGQGARSRLGPRRSRGPLRRTEVGAGGAPAKRWNRSSRAKKR